MEPDPTQRSFWRRRDTYRLAGAWIVVAIMFWFYGQWLVRAGLNLRDFMWEYTRQTWFGGDINSAMHTGAEALRHAQNLPPAPGLAPTIWVKGPGLLDPPLNPSTFLQRWHRLQPVYARIIAGWVDYYDFIDQKGPDPEFDPDYPPMRMMMMTLWMWKVQTTYPYLNGFPNRPEPARPSDRVGDPIIGFNTLCSGVAAIGVFLLVWVWVQRGAMRMRPSWMTRWVRGHLSQLKMPVLGRRAYRGALRFWPSPGVETVALAPAAVPKAEPRAARTDQRISPAPRSSWRDRWGDPLLLLPVILLGVATLIRPYVNWTWDLPGLDDTHLQIIDARTMSLSWWFFLTLRFTAAVCLARFLPQPFRGPACGLIAATVFWLNPSVIYDSHGWPQWDVWQLPFYIIGALLVSLDFWTAAGIVLGFGCMFKGQILFAIPILVLCPLFAGYLMRFLRIAAGLVAGAGIVVWPWLVTNDAASAYIGHVVLAAAIVIVLAIFRAPVRRRMVVVWNWLTARHPPRPATTESSFSRFIPWALTILWVTGMLIAAVLILGLRLPSRPTRICMLLLCAGLLSLPYFTRRRLIFSWLVIAFAAALAIVTFNLGAKFSWWDIGFWYGTQRHPEMQLGNEALSSFGSILNERYGWGSQDSVGTLTVPFSNGPIDLNLHFALGLLYGLMILVCCIGAAIQMRRNDPRFLVAVAAPYVLFPILLPQMSARYFCLPAALSTLMVGVSVPMALTCLVLTFVGLATVLVRRPDLAQLAPQTYRLVRPMHPDMGWMMLLIALIYVIFSVAPSRRFFSHRWGTDLHR